MVVVFSSHDFPLGVFSDNPVSRLHLAVACGDEQSMEIKGYSLSARLNSSCGRVLRTYSGSGAWNCKKMKNNSILPLIIIIIDRFYIALFSALEQTHCARM